MFKNRKLRRVRLEWRDEFDHIPRGMVGHCAHISYKKWHKYVRRNPISDAMFCDDLSYVPFRYIKGTLHLPGANPTKGYVEQ